MRKLDEDQTKIRRVNEGGGISCNKLVAKESFVARGSQRDKTTKEVKKFFREIILNLWERGQRTPARVTT